MARGTRHEKCDVLATHDIAPRPSDPAQTFIGPFPLAISLLYITGDLCVILLLTQRRAVIACWLTVHRNFVERAIGTG